MPTRRPAAPMLLRGIYPIVATITAAGWQRVGDDELAVAVTRRSPAEVRSR